jgi:TonB family protein
MSMTKLQLGLSSALAVAGATGFLVEANTNAKLRDEVTRLREQNAAITELQAENLRLGRLAVEVEEMRRDDVEFVRLQREAGELKTRLQQIARAEQGRKNRAGKTFDISMLDQTPVARFQARPQYPFEMRRAGINGEVVVDFVVDTNGEVQNAYAVRSSQREFEAAAVQAVMKWKFKPGKKGGQDVNTHMQVPIVFSLGGQTRPSPPLQPTRSDAAPAGSAGANPSVNLSPFHVVGTGSPSTEKEAAPRE